jgi:hypothetical protein
MITRAAPPEQTAARMRGSGPNTSEPSGSSSATIGPTKGVTAMTPAAKADRSARPAVHGRPQRGPPSSSTVPRASQGTFRMAPNR